MADKPIDFVHLHVHSHYSLLDGVAQVPPMIQKAAALNQRAIALTDHGNLFGAMEFYTTCIDFSKAHPETSVKPIIGCEFYVAPEDRYTKNKDEKYYHLVLLAKDITGYKNLLKLSSAGYTEGFYSKPRIDHELLESHSQGLIALSACLAGEIPSAILANDETKLKKKLEWYKETFGKDNFFLELQDHGIAEQKIVNQKLVRLSREYDIPLVATNDSHYLSPDDSILQEIIFAIRDHKTLKDETRQRYPTNQFYLKSSEEMAALFGEIPESLSNTIRIAEMCNVNFSFKEMHTPIYPLPKGENAHSYLTKLAQKGLMQRFHTKTYEEVPEEYRKRLQTELDLIRFMEENKGIGFSNYFLIVRDFVHFAKHHGIGIGPGRGSAAGAILSWVLDITQVDPIRYQLLFERFLNPERVSMPDIDIDFEDSRRDEVKEYIRSKYGYNKTADIITFGMLKSRSTLRDVGRVLDIPLAEVDRIAKLIDPNDSIEDALQKVPEIASVQKQDETRRKWIEYSLRLDGNLRNLGTHASGIIISDVELTEVVPLYRDVASGIISTQYEGAYLEKNGLLKMDILGLANLSIIKDTLERIWHNHHIRLDIQSIPLDDPQVYATFSRGETKGIFQFESAGMTRYLQELQPTNIEDLIAMNALYRPGPMDQIPAYIRRKKGLESVDCFHENLKPILQSTYGIIVYQEQVMQIAQVLAGFSLGKADNVRRIMAKKKPEELEKIYPDWIEGAVKNGYSRELAERIFEILVPFSSYAFNKSHSAAYAILAYQIAYLKTHYRAEFMASLLTGNKDKTDDVKAYCEECTQAGITILPPDINESFPDFREQRLSPSQWAIRFGFGALKGMGEGFSHAIVKERETNGPFTSFENFIERMHRHNEFRRPVVEILLKAGAFDSLFGEERLEKKARYLSLLDWYIETHEAKYQDQMEGLGTLFDMTEHHDLYQPPNKHIQHISLLDEFTMEQEVIGFPLTRRLIKQFQEKLDSFVWLPPENISLIPFEITFLVWGFLTNVEKRKTTTQKTYISFTLSYDSLSFNCSIFSPDYEKFAPLIKENQFVLAKILYKKGKGNQTYTNISELLPLDEKTLAKFSIKNLNLLWKGEPETLKASFKTLYTLLQKPEYRGPITITLLIVEEKTTKVMSLPASFAIAYSPNLLSEIRKLPGLQGFWFL